MTFIYKENFHASSYFRHSLSRLGIVIIKFW